jgi:phage tail-like protein
MDANGTRFHLLLGFRDWAASSDAEGRQLADLWDERAETALQWDARRHELRLTALPFTFPTGGGATRPRLADRRGAAADRYGSWYWVDPARTAILVRSAGSDAVSRFWAFGEEAVRRPRGVGDDFEPLAAEPIPPPARLGGLTVTRDHYLVVGVLDPPGLLWFDLHAGGPPEQANWPEGVPFAPFDLAPRPGGGIVALDRDNARLWQFDGRLRVVSLAPPADERRKDFEPGGAQGPGAGPIRLEDATPLAGDPLAVDVAADDSVLVLAREPDEPATVLRRYARGDAGEPVRTEGRGLVVDGHDIALLSAEPGTGLGTLYVAAASGDQALAFELALDDGGLDARLDPAFYPLRLFGGKALVSAGGQAWYDHGERWLAVTEQPRRRFVTDATLLTPVFDAHEPATVWHRLMLDGCVPPGTAVRVWSRAADDRDALEHADWYAEPAPRPRRESELPFVDAPDAHSGTWELLFQRARGRFLGLRLELTGDGRTSPRLRALRAHYPRFSYLDEYLPSVYREDPESASFLDRFLANVEGILTPLEDQIAAVQLLFDPRTAPAEALDWLAGWFDVAVDPAWDEAKRRLFIRRATDFFAARGTIRGLRSALRLALAEHADESLLGEAPPGRDGARIVERFRLRRAPGVVAGDPTEGGGPRVVLTGGRWRPADGGEALHRRFAGALAAAGLAAEPFPFARPGDPAAEAIWRRFAEETLGFVPGATAADEPLWRDFLARRYGLPAELAAAYGLPAELAPASFDDVQLTTSVPADGAPLQDRFDFESVVLPTRREAHRFSVLLPVPTAGASRGAPSDPVALRELVRRIVELEKPAHTVFDIRFFWAAFRIGEARLGADTLLDVGSRAPDLCVPAVLGRDYLGETYLHEGLDPDLARRREVGFQRLER